MIRIDVELNGESYCRAGLDGSGVISVMLHWMDFDGSAVTDDADHPWSALSFNVIGHRAERAFTSDDAREGAEPPGLTPIHWGDVKHGLRVGDELRIRIVEAASGEADPSIDTPPLPPLHEE